MKTDSTHETQKNNISKRGIVSAILQERVYSLTILLVLIIVVSSFIWPDTFPKMANISAVLLNVSFDTIVAVGMMILMISGAFDLSVGSVAGFSGGVTAFLMYYHDVSIVVAILAGVAVAGLVGLVNGMLISLVGVNPMIQTLAMLGIARGGALLTAGAGIQNMPKAFNVIGQFKFLGVQSPFWFALTIVVIFSILVGKTSFFKRYYYIGGNEKAAKLSGINVKKMKVMSFVLSSILAGLTGILLTSRMGGAMSSFGTGMELRVITAVIIGGASLEGGVGKIPGAFLGTIFMGLVNNIMIIAGVSVYWQQILIGVILILAVTTDVIFQKKTR